MARLSLGLFGVVFLLAATVFPIGNPDGVPAQEPANARVHRLEALLDAPRLTDSGWRQQVWQQLKRLEHGPSEVVLAGWQALAESGRDSDQANLLIYQRRHGLAVEPVKPGEGVEVTLERCLHLWGSGQKPQSRDALISAIQRFPQDRRFHHNLNWLNLAPPASLSWNDTPREFALGVLAARHPHH